MRFWQLVSRRAIILFLIVFTSALYLVNAQEWESTDEPTADGATLTLVWQTEFNADAMLVTPGDVAVDQWGNSYVTTQGNNTVKKFDSDGNFVTQWGGNGKEDGRFSLTLGIAVDAEDNVYVTDFYNRRIQKFDSDGNFLSQWATEQTTSPAFMALDADGNIYVDEFPPYDEHYILKYDLEGNLLSEWGAGADGELFSGIVEDITVDAEGNLYVADRVAHRVQKVSPDGELLATFGGEEGGVSFEEPFGIAVDPDGNIFVLNDLWLQKLDADGNLVAQWSTAGGDFDRATNVGIDSEGHVYVFAFADVVAPSGAEVNVLVLKKFSQS